MLEEEVYTDTKDFLKASVEWANDMEKIIQDVASSNIRNSELEKNLSVLKEEINREEGQDYSRIYQLMYDIKSGYEVYARTEIKNGDAEDINEENNSNETEEIDTAEQTDLEDEIRLKSSNEMEDLCFEFAQAVNGKGSLKNGICSVDLHRQFTIEVEGKTSSSVVPASIVFESLDKEGNALNLVGIAVLEEELPLFVKKVTQEGLIVSAIHNHWIYTEPVIMYVHIQSVEPPVSFARKMAKSFSALKTKPTQ